MHKGSVNPEYVKELPTGNRREVSMAERALYQNTDEPEFPFSDVIPSTLDWLPSFVSSAADTPLAPKNRNLDLSPSLFDTVLVFARARTAALYLLYEFEACQSLVSSLNSILENIGTSEALYHKLELVRRGPLSILLLVVIFLDLFGNHVSVI